MAKEETEHKKRRYLLIILMALLVAFLAVIMAQNAQDTADINNVFAIVVNNTDLGSMGTKERLNGVTYWANESPLQIEIITHTVTTGTDIIFNFSINNTKVWEYSKRSAVADEHHSVLQIVPKGANYTFINSTNIHHYEWREYPILSGRNGTLNVTQILNASGDFIPYVGANKNVTVGVNNFTIFSMDGNSSIYLPNTTHGGILIQQYQNAGHTLSGDIHINGTILAGVSNSVIDRNATYTISETAHIFKINNTDKAAITKDGLVVSNITSVGINNGDYPNSTLQATKFNKTAGLTDVITGITYINSTAPTLRMTDTDSTGAAAIMVIEFYNSTGQETGFVGDPTGSGTDIIVGSIDNGVAIYAGGNIRVRYYANGSVQIVGLAGSGQDYVCVDAGGMLIRSNAAC